MEGRIGGLIYLDGHGLNTAELIGGNPPLYLPPEVMNNSSYVTGSVGINTIQMPADTSDASFYEFIEPIAPTGGILGDNRIWNGVWSPYKVKEMYRLKQSIPLANSGCTDLGGNRSQNVYALMPDFSTTGRYADLFFGNFLPWNNLVKSKLTKCFIFIFFTGIFGTHHI